MSLHELSQLATPTLGGLLGLCVLLILTGRLVPLATLKRELGAEQRRADAEQARADKACEQVDLLLGYAHTADQVLRALPRPSDRAET